MNDAFDRSETGSKTRANRRGLRVRAGAAAALIAVAVVGATAMHTSEHAKAATMPAPAPSVVVSTPVQRKLETKLGFLGQFSAVERVELRAQVGGTLTGIHFKDGDIVHKGDLLFEIDSVPYEIKLNQATAQLESAHARLDLATHELVRAEALKSTDAGTTENVEQRASEKLAAEAAVDDAKAQVRDAKFDMDHCRITAPFTGRMGTHLVSVGNLVAGSRAASSPTTLLATLVSLDPIYLDFDMSEGEYMTFLRERAKQKNQSADSAEISLSDEVNYSHKGELNFVDNSLNRASGTIHARAIVPNGDLLMTPGGFARVRLAVSTPQTMLLVPDSSVIQDQSQHIVLTLGPDNVVTPKQVQLGEIIDGLRVIRSGLESSDKVIIDGIPFAMPGSKVSPRVGSIQPASDQG
jgi:RND family efflux transporter MFP subunit